MMRITVVLLAIATLTSGFVYPRFRFNPRIVGGDNATEGQFPYQISLRYYGSHHCGGSILNKNWALTAAHCVDGYPTSTLTVVSGSIYLSGGGNVNDVIAVIVHDDWDLYNIKNDIAVLKIDGEFDLGSDFISPISLEDNFIGVEGCVVSGWGKLHTWGSLPDELQFIHLTTLSIEDCQQRWDGIPVSECEICTLTKVGEGVCNGDSGGPLVIEGRQIGIVSWGNACANGLPDVYTRISCYIEWILEAIN